MSKKGGYYCAFKNCRGLSRRDKRSFFRFPKDPERSKQWVRACNRNDLLEKTPIELFNSYRVCAKHFTDSMFLNDLRNRLQPNSVPTHFSQQQPDQIQVVGNNNETNGQQQPIVVAGTTAATTQLVTCNTTTANNDFDIVDEAQIQLADCSHDSVAKILSNCVFQKISADEFFKATGICIKEPSSSSEPTNHNIRATTNDDSTTTTVEDYLRSSSGKGDCSLSTADHVYSSTAVANCNEPQLTNNAVDSSSSCYGIKDILVDPSSSSFSIEGLSYQDLMGCSSLQPLSSLIAPIEICGNDDDDVNDLRSFSMSRVVGLDDVDRLPDTILEGQEDDDEEVDEDSSSELSNSLESFQPSLQTSVVVDDVDVVVAAACLEAASTASSSSSSGSNASQGNKSTGEACTQTNAYHLLPSDNNKLDKVSQTENDDDNNDKKEPSSPSFHEPRSSSIVSRDRANKRKLKRILQVKRCEIKSLKSKLLKQNLVELMEHVTLEQYKSLTERFFPKETSDFIKTQAQLFDQEKISQDKQYSLEFKKQCLALFLTGPRTYKNLQKIFCLPAVHDLQTLKF